MNLLLLFSLHCFLWAVGKADDGPTDLHQSRPAILLVPGAFHQGQIIYEPVRQQLKLTGYDEHLIHAIDLPSVGSLATRDDDVNAVVQVMKKYLEQGRDVVLVGNSGLQLMLLGIYLANNLQGYGCTVAGDAVAGIPSAINTSPYDPNGRRRGRVLNLIFFSGYLPYIAHVQHPETHPDIRLVSPTWFAFWPNGSPSTIPLTVRWDGDLVNFPPQKEFYNVLQQENPQQADYYVEQSVYPSPVESYTTCHYVKLRNSSFAALNAASRYIPYTGDFEVIYVAGKQDNSVPAPLWESYVNQAGAKFTLEMLDADHVPMVSRPRDVTDLILKYVQLGSV
ncbi:unnamed protein product [Periconia digitata]|uniref:AB hydrolase-1 domain-containing protein n=1 Tax=Periconia digitata TaxID=1303443 RepID=A0A9W4UPW9_9PLEO|nr:unnamed protein product [Periconia digitata]